MPGWARKASACTHPPAGGGARAALGATRRWSIAPRCSPKPISMTEVVGEFPELQG